MRSRDFSSWMWDEALSLLDRAERLHRQFFTHVTHAWEFPCREEGVQIRRIEIPYGRFERRIAMKEAA